MPSFVMYANGADPGDPRGAMSLDELYTRHYDELRRLARSICRGGRVATPTSIVDGAAIQFYEDGSHEKRLTKDEWFGVMYIKFRQLLVDLVRRANAMKRGGKLTRQMLTDDIAAVAPEILDASVQEVRRAMMELRRFDKFQFEVVMLHAVGGLTHAMIAGILESTQRKVEREWLSAIAWLRVRLSKDQD